MIGPLPKPAAVCAFVGATGMVGIAIICDAQGAAVLASGLLLGLAAAFAWTSASATRLRDERVQLALRLGNAAGRPLGLVAGAAFELRAELENPGRRALCFTHVAPMLPAGLESRSTLERTLHVPARSRVSFALVLAADAAGRYVVHGVALTLRGPCGAFAAPVYFPAPLAVHVLPRGVLLPPIAAGASAAEGSAALIRSRGFGLELHELREHRPGDPFNTIAWKPSARLGKLLVREHEHDRQTELSIVLDASCSMRHGRAGQRALDRAIELSWGLTQRAIDSGDRVGLLTLDTRVIGQTPPGAGKTALFAICGLLMQTTEVVDEDRTEADESLLFERVGAYLHQQLGLDFGRGSRWDRGALLRHVEQALQRESDRSARQIVAFSPVQLALRHFCRARGLELPLRPEAPPEQKQAGLANAMRVAAGTGRVGRSLIVMSDLSRLGTLDSLLGTAAMLQRQRHALTFLVLESAVRVSAETAPVERALGHIAHVEERLERARRIIELRRAGIAVVTSAVSDRSIAAPPHANPRRAA